MKTEEGTVEAQRKLEVAFDIRDKAAGGGERFVCHCRSRRLLESKSFEAEGPIHHWK